MKKLLDNPYLAPLTTPLKWVGQCAAQMFRPYTDPYNAAQANKKHVNPFINYLQNMFDEKVNTGPSFFGACFLVGTTAVLGAIGGFFAGGHIASGLLAGVIFPVKAAGMVAALAAGTAAGAVALPLVVAAAAAVAAVVVPAVIVTVPGILYGCKQTFDHVTGRAAAPVPTVPSAAPPLADQINAQLADMPDDQKKDMLDLMKNGIGCTFAANAATTLDNKIAVAKTIRLKKPNP